MSYFSSAAYMISGAYLMPSRRHLPPSGCQPFFSNLIGSLRFCPIFLIYGTCIKVHNNIAQSSAWFEFWFCIDWNFCIKFWRSKIRFCWRFWPFSQKCLSLDHATWFTVIRVVFAGVCKLWPPFWSGVRPKLGPKSFSFILQNVSPVIVWNLILKLTRTTLRSM